VDPRLIGYYNTELNYLRELGAEFAAANPKIAARLGMRDIEVADPYVERLLEGFSFLTARIQLKMDAEFPRFSQRLLEVIYPNYLAPTPAMCIVQFTPGEMTGNQGDSFRIGRGERLRAPSLVEGQNGCEFRTAHDVDLWPLRINAARFEGVPTDVRVNRLRQDLPVKASLRLNFQFNAPLSGKSPPPDRLSLHLAGSPHITSRLHELLCGHVLGVSVRARSKKQVGEWRQLGAAAVQPEGFDDTQALLPYNGRGFQGYRLLHEYFAFPARFHFVALEGLRAALQGVEALDGFEVSILLDQEVADLETVVDAAHFLLFCTPAVNLISMRSDRIQVGDSRYELHVVPDRTHPLNYEVYSIEQVEGFGRDNAIEAKFRPFYSSLVGDRGNHGTYFTVRREPRLASSTSARHGARTTYLGSEVFLSLVNQHEAPYGSGLRQLGVDMTVTNRDLAMLMAVGGQHDLVPVDSVPVSGVRVLQGPTRPVPAVPEGEISWRLISHLGLNHQTLTDLSPEQGALALRELLSLYTVLGDAAVARQANAVLQTRLNPITRRLPGAGPITFGRGVGIDVTIDESHFAGTSPYLFGAVLEQFFARHVALNTFTETRLVSAQRGQLGHWAPRFGRRPVA
jgi:type VI secretion system protein ImpG